MKVQQEIEKNDPLFDRKVDVVTAGLPQFSSRYLRNEVSRFNALTVCNYILSMKTEINLSDNYRRTTIVLLIKLSKFFNNEKSFNQITREDVLSFLDRLRKPENLDPFHKWVGTYNLYTVKLSRFFKWLYYPDMAPDKRPKPKVIGNIPQLKRKE